MSQSGFISLIVIIIAAIIALSAATGGAVYYQTHSIEPVVEIEMEEDFMVGIEDEEQMMDTEDSDVFEEVATEPEEVTKQTPKKAEPMQELYVRPRVSSMPNISPMPVVGITHEPQVLAINSRAQFSVVQEELTGAKISGMFLSKTHYERIIRDLDALEQAGYAANDINELRSIAVSLAPHIKDEASPPPTASSTGTMPLNTGGQQPPSCADNSQAPQLTEDMTDFSKIKKITAPGSASHEGPKGHSYIWTDKERVPVYLPAAAVLDSGSYSKDNAESPAHFLLLFTMKENCNYNLKFDHIDDPIGSIKAAMPATPKVSDSRTSPAIERIEFKAGDLIGYTHGTDQAGTWDFGIYYLKEPGPLAALGSYGLHGFARCWVDFYTPQKQEQYRRLLEGPKLLCSF